METGGACYLLHKKGRDPVHQTLEAHPREEDCGSRWLHHFWDQISLDNLLLLPPHRVPCAPWPRQDGRSTAGTKWQPVIGKGVFERTSWYLKIDFCKGSSGVIASNFKAMSVVGSDNCSLE
jgi:hypothetical protein